jgi:hypothetical protein
MIVAWVLLAPNGILIARNYKFLFGDRKFLGVKFWFTLHPTLMMAVPLISLIGLLIVLSWHHWLWIEADEKIEFSHSIFGIVAISLAFVQVTVAQQMGCILS